MPIPAPLLDDAEAPVARAVADAREALQRRPEDAEAWGRYGIVLDAHGFLDEALQCYEQAAQRDPQEPRWPYLTAVALSTHDPAAALPHFERAVTIAPENAAIRHQLGDALLRAGRPEESRSQYEQSLQIDPTARRAMLGLAELALRSGALEEAEARLQQAAELDFCDREVHAKLARLYQRRGDRQRARREAQLVEAYPDLAPSPDPLLAPVSRAAVSSKAMAGDGLSLVGAGRFGEAERVFRRILKVRPDSVRNRLNLGGVLVRQGRLDEAIAIFGEARELAPEDPEVYNNLAVALGDRGDVTAAFEALDTALRLDPGHDEAHFNRGRLLARQGRTKAAIEALEQALQLNPGNAPAHNELGRLLAARGQVDAAIAHWRDAMDFGCHNPEAAVNLAVTLAQRGEFGQALSALHRALGEAPDHEAATAAMATILATCPRPEHRDGVEAVRLARRLVKRNGQDHVPSLNLLAAALAERGDFADAAQLSELALQRARAAGNAGLVAQITRRLALYRAGRPYHQPDPALPAPGVSP